MPSSYTDVGEEDVLRFIGTKPTGFNVSASEMDRLIAAEAKYDRPLAALQLQPVTPSRLRRRSAVALGGLAGNNAHGAGFLEALRRSGKKPALISCTSGQILWACYFLQGKDLLEEFKKWQSDAQPFGSMLDWNVFWKLFASQQQHIQPSLREFPSDAAAVFWRTWSQLLAAPLQFSVIRAASNAVPARSLVSEIPADTFRMIADVFNAEDEKDEKKEAVGVLFNAYDFKEGHEYVHLNKTAARLIDKKRGDDNEHRPWIKYRPITPRAVEDALRLYEYGFAGGSSMLDGAYFRGIILSEIPDPKHNKIDRIAVVRPQADRWIGSAPLSWIEMKDMQTEVNFNGTYFGERERIRLMNRLLEEGRTKKDVHKVALLELPLNVQRGWFDYIFESEDVFASACIRGMALAQYL